MKKIRLFCAVALVAFTLESVKSQTVITYNNHAPQIGQSVTLMTLTSGFDPINIDPGTPGPNKTWNFSTFVGDDEYTTTFIDPTTTPFADSIVGMGINLAIQFIDDEDAGYSFLTVNQTSLLNKGFGMMDYGAPFMFAAYDPALMLMKYPFAYNESFNSYGQYQIALEGFQMINKSWTTSTADAYGTLITPVGTFNNALRIKTISIDSTFINIPGFPMPPSGSESIDYVWFSNDHRFMIFSIYGEMNEGVFEAYDIDYLVTETVGVQELAHKSLHFYPNPASDFINITKPGSHFGLYDMQGRKMLEATSTDQNINRLDVRYLPEGLYFLKELSGSEVVSSSKVMIKR